MSTAGAFPAARWIPRRAGSAALGCVGHVATTLAFAPWFCRVNNNNIFVIIVIVIIIVVFIIVTSHASIHPRALALFVDPPYVM
jgi:hypothetical protein